MSDSPSPAGTGRGMSGSQVLLLLWFSIMSSKIIYVIVGYGLRNTIPFPLANADPSLPFYIAAGFAFVALLATRAAKMLTTRMLRPIEQPDDAAVRQKIMSAFLLRCALFETPAVLGLMLFLMTGKLHLFAAFAGYSFALDLVNVPTRGRLRGWARMVHPKTELYKSDTDRDEFPV